MNEFIELRNSYFNKPSLRSFDLIFLEKYSDSYPIKDAKEKILFDNLTHVLLLTTKNQIKEKDMIEALSYLGQDDYLDRSIVNMMIKNSSLLSENAVKKRVNLLLTKQNLTDSVVFSLLDSFIECDLHLLSKEQLTECFAKYQNDFTVFSLLIDYLHHFKVDGFEQIIYEWLKKDYPINIKIQLLDLLVELYSLEKLDKAIVEDVDYFQENEQLYNDYMSVLKKEKLVRTNGLTILQSMFYGDFENSGKGNNGGMAVFLKTLGNELSKSEKVSLVVTLTITNEWAPNQSLMNFYSDNHLFIRAPIYIDTSSKDPFLKNERFIKRGIKRFLKRIEIEPDIFHVRYLDNASKAIALLSKESNKKFVFTLTPDPHRNMSNSDGLLKEYSFSEFLQKLNKIMIGDELVSESDQIVGIGNYRVKKELELYFPQLLIEDKKDDLWMISEGIQSIIPIKNNDEQIKRYKEWEERTFTKNFFDKPIILNVGRLEQQKAQDELLKAWGNSPISDWYNLLLIGGDLENPNTDEQKMMHTFESFLNEQDHLRKSFRHIGALSNEKIRIIEKKIMEHQTNVPQIYLCSSKKEEFGIAILEALSQKFLVLGPERGGVKSYLENGTNGFLIDTTNWKTISKETEKIIKSLKNNKTAFEKIQNAGEKTVKDHFSMEKIANEFLLFYLSLKRRKANEC